MKQRIVNPIKLCFDPALPPRDDEEREVRQVFADDLARTLWLAIRPSHIVSQFFHTNCLQLARQIRKAMPITSADELRRAAYGHYAGESMSIYLKDPDFLAELLPYIQGVKRLEWGLADKMVEYQI